MYDASLGATESVRFDKVRTRLGVRLLPLDMEAEGLLEIDRCSAFRTCIQIDSEYTVRFVLKSDVAESGATDREFWDQALFNLRSEPLLALERIETADTLELYLGDDESFTTASHVLRLADYGELASEFGQFVAVPSRHSLLVAPIRSRSSLQLMSTIRNFADEDFEQGPGSISPELLWHLNGKLTPIGINRELQQWVFPVALRSIIDQLPGE